MKEIQHKASSDRSNTVPRDKGYGYPNEVREPKKESLEGFGTNLKFYLTKLYRIMSPSISTRMPIMHNPELAESYLQIAKRFPVHYEKSKRFSMRKNYTTPKEAATGIKENTNSNNALGFH